MQHHAARNALSVLLAIMLVLTCNGATFQPIMAMAVGAPGPAAPDGVGSAGEGALDEAVPDAAADGAGPDEGADGQDGVPSEGDGGSPAPDDGRPVEPRDLSEGEGLAIALSSLAFIDAEGNETRIESGADGVVDASGVDPLLLEKAELRFSATVQPGAALAGDTFAIAVPRSWCVPPAGERLAGANGRLGTQATLAPANGALVATFTEAATEATEPFELSIAYPLELADGVLKDEPATVELPLQGGAVAKIVLPARPQTGPLAAEAAAPLAAEALRPLAVPAPAGTDVTQGRDQLDLGLVTFSYLDAAGKRREVPLVDGSDGRKHLDFSQVPFASIGKMSMEVDFQILLNDARRAIEKGDYYVYRLPSIFTISDVLSPQDIVAPTGDVLGSFTIIDGEIRVAFSEIVDIDQGNVDIAGGVACEFDLNGDSLNSEGPKEVEWELQTGGTTYVFHAPKSSTDLAGIEKTGVFNKDDSSVTWTVAVGTDPASAGAPLKGVTVADAYDKTAQTGVVVRDAQGGELVVAETSAGFEYTFPENSTAVAPYELTVTADVAPDVLRAAANGAQTLGNEAEMSAPAGSSVTVTGDPRATGSAIVPPFGLDKQGTPLDSSTIAWDIVVNKGGTGSAQNVVVYDRLDKRAAYLDGTLKVNGVPVDVYKHEPNPAPTGDYAVLAHEAGGTTLLAVHFAGTVGDERRIAFDTNINASAQPDETVKFPNEAWMTYDWPSGAGPVPVAREPLSIGTDFQVAYLDKETPRHDDSTGVIDWTVKPSTRTENYTRGVITDDIPADQEFVDGSVIVKHGGVPLSAAELAAVFSRAEPRLTFTFDKAAYDLNDIEISFQTRALNFQNENMVNHEYVNAAHLDVYQGADRTFQADDTAQRAFENRFLAKTSDYSVADDPSGGSTGYVHYRIVLNENQMPSRNLRLVDDLGALATQVVDAAGAQIDSVAADKWIIATDPAHAIKVTKREPGSPEVNATDAAQVAKWIADRKIDASFGDTSACYTVDLWLTLDKAELQRLQKAHDGSFSLRPVNKATASSNAFNGGTPVDVTCTGAADSDDIDNRLVAKSADGSHQADGYLEYRINVNPNGSNLAGAVITDTPDPSLDIDLDSVALYRAQHGEDGAIVEAVGDAVDASAWSKELAYDAGADRAVLKVGLPDGTASYVLKYRARVVGAPSGSSVANDVTLVSSDGQKGFDRCEAEVDSSSWGWLTKKAVYKFVKADEFGEKATPIAGIVFKLYEDAARTRLVKTGVSNAQGIVAFYGLDLKKTYYYEEDPASVPGTYYQVLAYGEATCQFTTGGEGSSTIASAAVKNKRTVSNVPVEIAKTFEGAGGLNPQSTFRLHLYANGFGGAKKVPVKVEANADGTYSYTDGTGSEELQNKAADGKLVISGLPWGDYGLEEVDPARGYAAYEGMKCFSVAAPAAAGGAWSVDYAPTDATEAVGASASIANAKTAIAVKKTTPAGNDLAGAVLRIYEDNAGTKGGLAKDPFHSDGPFEYTASTGAEFTWDIAGLPAGTYWLSEDVAPADPDVGRFEDVEFEVDKHGTLTVLSGGGSAEGQTIKVVDEANKVSVKKLDQWGAGVAGATLTLKKLDGATWVPVPGAAWTPATAVEAAAGHDFGRLERGKTYRVVETGTLPPGYATANHGAQQMIEFTIDEYGKVTNTDLHNGDAPNGTDGTFQNSRSGNSFTMRNERVVGHAEFVKHDTTLKDDGTNKTLAGVKFDLYLKGATGDTLVNTGHFASDANGKVATQGSSLKFAADLGTAKEGEPISRGLPEGTYYFKEVATYDDFVFDKDNPLVTDTFTVDKTGQHYTWKNDGSFGDVATVTKDGGIITNEPLNAEVHLWKMEKDPPHYEINGATFELREKGTGKVVDRQMTTYANRVFKNTIKEADSNGNVHTAKESYHDGSLVFVNVPAGTYEVVETIPAPGYQIDAQQKIADVTVTQERANVEYQVEAVDPVNTGWIINEPNKFSVEKAGQNGQSIVGTRFELSGVDGATFAKAGAGLISWEVFPSANNPYEIVGELAVGSVYKLAETAPAPGYQLAADVYLRMTATGELQKSASAGGPWTAVGSNNKLAVANVLNELSIAKKDQFGNPVSGATLQLSGQFANATSPIEWKTGAAAKDIAGELVAGREYTLHESATPDGYLTAADQVVRMTAAGQLQARNASGGWDDVAGNALAFVNELSLAHAKIVKTEADGSPFTGATFDLCRKDGSVLIGGIKPAIDGDGKASWSTQGASGSNPDTGRPFSEGLVNGEYRFVETATDNDHVLDATPRAFALDNATHGTTVETTAVNERMNASVSLLKVDATDTATPVEGAAFELAYTPAGSTSSTTTTLTTGPDGLIKAENLGKGAYALKETGTDASYKNGGFEASFEVTEACQDVPLVIGRDAVGKAPYNLHVAADEAHLLAGSLSNERVLGTVNVEKQDADGNALEGVTFEVRKASDDAAVASKTTAGEGKATFADLPWGDYYLVETAVPAGYVLDDTHHEFAIGKGVLTKNFTVAGDGAITNKRNEFTLEKHAADGMTGLSGATFTIAGTFAGGTGEETRTLLDAAQSVTWTGQLVGGSTYTIAETTPPKGYQTVPAFDVTMNADGTLSFPGAHEGVELDGNVIKVSDSRNTASIAKLDEGGASLAGARFKLSGAFADGSAERTWTSITADEVLEGLLVAGVEYQLTETAPAPGYTLPEALPAMLRMTDDGQLERKDGSGWVAVPNNRFVVEDVENALALTKQDAGGNPLPGASFEVKGTFADGATGVRTMLDGAASATLTGELVAGSRYTVHEVAPPEGYVATDDFAIVMNADGTVAADGALPDGVSVSGHAVVVKDEQNAFTLAKYADDGVTELEGAVFEITGTFAGGTAEETRELLNGAKSETNPGMLVGGNSYTLHEKTPPEGCKPVGDFQVTMGADGALSLVGAPDGVELDGTVVKVRNERVKASLAKVDESGAPLAGAELKLAGKFAGTADTQLTWTSSDTEAWNLDGRLIVGETYALTEPRLAGHLTLPGAVTFTVKDDGSLSIERNQEVDGMPAASLANGNVRLNLLNVVIAADVELTKTLDGAGALSGVTFDLYEEGAGSPLKSGLVTDADGKIKVEGLPEGSYYFVETATVDGAVVDTAHQTFTVGEGQHHTVVPVAMDNTSFKTSVSLAKVDGASGEALAGAQFALFKKDAGGAFQPLGSPVATNEHGMASFTMSERGTYRVQETAAPTGYAFDPGAPFSAEFTVENTGEFQNETLKLAENVDAATVAKYNLTVENARYKDGFVANERKLGSVTLAKIDASTGDPLNGVEFELYAAGDPATPLGTFATGDPAGDGALSVADLAWGDYYLQETRADGYKLDATHRGFSIGARELSVDLGTVGNDPIVFSFDKVELHAESCSDPVLGAEDPAGTRPLEGAEFTLFADEACARPAKLADGGPAAAASDADGLVRFERVAAGSYFVKETAVPAGHADNPVVYALDVTTDGTVTCFASKGQGGGVLDQVANDVHRADIRIKKVAETDEGKVLPNSVYGLFKRVAPEARTLARASLPQAAGPDGGLRLIAKATTGPDGHLVFEGVLMGAEYVIQELVAPDGSLVSKNPVKLTFAMGPDGEPRIVAFDDGSGTAKVDENGDIVWREPQVVVGFAKTDPSGALLAGAKLHVVDEAGAVVGEPWTSSADGEHLVEGVLTAGKTYRLVEAQAPAGYRKAADVEFTVDDPKLGPDEGHVQQVTMVNHPEPAAPASARPGILLRTGDPATQLALLAGGMALACGAVAGAASIRRRRKG